jgi:hypothetical protein
MIVLDMRIFTRPHSPREPMRERAEGASRARSDYNGGQARQELANGANPCGNA